jgi:AcrR family transcriptional regulator
VSRIEAPVGPQVPEGRLQIVYHGLMTGRNAPGPGAPGSSGARGLRADAERNRAAILAVARDVFAEQGLEAPLEMIAARAGVGIATLYRRFPTREKLVAAALVEKIALYAQAAEQALAVPDPWAGFAGFVQRICELQACGTRASGQST